MKTYEWLVLIAGFTGIIGMFLKMPKMIVDMVLEQPKRVSSRIQFTNRCGTVMVMLFPALLIVASSYSATLESDSTRSKVMEWMLFIFLTSGLVFMYVMFLVFLYSVKKSLIAGGKILGNILEVIFKLGSTQFKSTSSKGGKGSKSFFYKAGEDFMKGSTENIPGDEWKYPKEDDEDENPPDSGPKNRWN